MYKFQCMYVLFFNIVSCFLKFVFCKCCLYFYFWKMGTKYRKIWVFKIILIISSIIQYFQIRTSKYIFWYEYWCCKSMRCGKLMSALSQTTSKNINDYKSTLFNCILRMLYMNVKNKFWWLKWRLRVTKRINGIISDSI